MNLTERHLEVLGHSLGMNVYGAKVSKDKKRYRTIPKEFGRNYFCAGDGHGDYPILTELKEAGHMTCTEPMTIIGGDRYWYVSETGIELFTSEFKKLYPK